MNRLATALFVIMLSAPVGVAATELDTTTTAVENHTSYVQILVQEERHRPANEYAAIAGLVACQPATPISQAVLWFNDQLLFEPDNPHRARSSCMIDPDTYVWAVEAGSPDPRQSPGVQATGDVFEFTDPNGVEWEVHEYTYYEVVVDHDQNTDVNAGPLHVGLEAEAQVRYIEHLAWVVKLGPETFDPTLVDDYNFVVLVNMTKMDHVREDRARHDGSAGNVRGGNSHDASRPDEEHRFPHRHDTVTMDLYTGPGPEEGDWPRDGSGVRLKLNDATVSKGMHGPR